MIGSPFKTFKTLPYCAAIPFIVAAAFTTTDARADFYIHPLKDVQAPGQTFRLTPELYFYSTSSNFRSDGSKVVPGTLDQYRRMGLDIEGDWGITPIITAFGRFSWASAQIDHISTTSTSASGPSVSGSGLPDQSVGLSLALIDHDTEVSIEDPNPFSLKFQVRADIPTYDNKASLLTLKPFMGDGSFDLTGAFFGSIFLGDSGAGKWFIVGGPGFTYRSDNFPAALPWSLNLKMASKALEPSTRLNPSSGVFVEAGLSGYHSLSSPTTVLLSSSLGAGGSFFINSPSPSHIDGAIKLGITTGPALDVFVHFSKTIFGQAAPDGFLASAGVTARFGAEGKTIRRRSPRPEDQNPDEFGQTNGGFVQYGLVAKVSKANDRLHMIKIDKGSIDGVEQGQMYDIFEASKGKAGDNRTQEPIARAKVTTVRDDRAILQIVEYYKEVWINEGFIAKRIL